MFDHLPTPYLVLVEACLKRLDNKEYAIHQMTMRETTDVLINNIYFCLLLKQAVKQLLYSQ